ncbi:16623_t:CDS:2, partial [Gigaspora rosea]
NVYGVERTPGYRLKCPGCYFTFTNSEKLLKHVQEIYNTLVRGLRLNQNARQIQRDNDNDTLSFKIKMSNQLDEIYKKLEIAEGKYSLIERGHPQISEFRKCLDSILLLKREIDEFNEKQIRSIQNVLISKVEAKKEKVSMIVEKLKEEIMTLRSELNKKSIIISLLNKKYKWLEVKYHAIKKDYETLISDNDNYYVESRRMTGVYCVLLSVS